MNTETFDKIVEERLTKIKDILLIKSKEYAVNDDRLYNFRRASIINKETPEQALWGMFTKHLVSVIDLVEGSTQVTEYLVNEKIGDAINYLILLEAIFKDKLSANIVPKESDVNVADTIDPELYKRILCRALGTISLQCIL
jgi:ERCC4-related helicase